MLAPSSGLLRAALELKLNQIKHATRSYLRDRTGQATGTLASYAIAAGLFAAAGIFLIAASLVGANALFRWIEINYGLFWAFGAVGLLLLTIAGLCASLAARRLRRPSPHFPSLTSRLRVAIKASPFKSRPIQTKPDRIGAASDTATAILRAPASPLSAQHTSRKAPGGPASSNRELQAGLMLAAATLLGWAAGRRVRQARRTPG
jgi:Putative Actinobacterial Holin-X, holin superfamily III